MATLVCFHAHPDDEAITTAGSMARAKAEGHRVVLVLATRGELGEQDLLAPGEDLATRRVAETMRSAEILGVDRVEFLPYRDSGMADDPRNHDAGTFHAAPLDEAAGHLAAVLRSEKADTLTVYDEHGNYGHPDHIKVHQVGYRAAELAGTPRVYEATVNRDYLKQLSVMRVGELPPEVEIPDIDEMNLGVTEDRITTWVDVSDYVALKRAAMAAHASQVAETSFFLQLPDDAFAQVFGWEWYIRRDAPLGGREPSLF